MFGAWRGPRFHVLFRSGRCNCFFNHFCLPISKMLACFRDWVVSRRQAQLLAPHPTGSSVSVKWQWQASFLHAVPELLQLDSPVHCLIPLEAGTVCVFRAGVQAESLWTPKRNCTKTSEEGVCNQEGMILKSVRKSKVAKGHIIFNDV